MRYAVELKLLPANPIDQIQWRAPKVAESVDRQVVINPSQGRDLLAAVRGIDPTLEAFFGCLYFAALRPGAALHLRDTDCTLPTAGWGELHLLGSTQRLSESWTGSATGREDRGLKHRPAADTPLVPAPPELVKLLRRHLDTYGADQEGHLFVTRNTRHADSSRRAGRSISNTRYTRVWREARARTLTPAQQRSPLAARPYDLRHAAVSPWLNAGVPATQVAEWAGHSVQVLL